VETMIRQICAASLFAILCFLSFHADVYGHGWGYKKNDEHRLPDIGSYRQLLQDHWAFYADEDTEKDIYVTFDNGYEEGYTEKVLNVLKKHEVPATFFVTGHYVESAPELIQRMVEDGHIIGNHSDTHPDFTTLTKDEMEKELQALEEKVANVSSQKKTIYFRPPRGTFNEQTLKSVEELGYVHVFWSLAFKDWETKKQRGWQYAYDNVMKQIHPGAIILLHTVSADNAAALERIIVDLKKDGYTFRSLDYLFMKRIFSNDVLFEP